MEVELDGGEAQYEGRRDGQEGDQGAGCTHLLEENERDGACRPFDSERWDAVLRALAEGAEKIPVMPPDDLTRAAIYGDHD